jgi:hypothetical protein
MMALLLLLVCLGSPIVLGADQTLPSAEVLINRYIEATGGKAAHEGITNRVAKGSMEFKAQGMKFDLTIYVAMPNLHYIMMESEALGTLEQGTDGDVVWELSVMTGPRIKEGQERLDLLRESRLDKWVEWQTIYKSAESVGVETVKGSKSYKVILTPKAGHSQTLYFDENSHLLTRVDSTVESPMGTLTTVTYLSDYRDVDGLLVSHRNDVEVAGQTRTLSFQSVEQNVALPDDRFALPDEIKALVAKEKKPE